MENNADILLIQQYLEGKLNPKQMHELEKQALDDPFLADALDGYAHAVKPVNSQLSILQRQLEERIAAQQEEKSVFNFTWQRLSIAAAAGLMFISAGILFWMNSNKESKQLAANAPKPGQQVSPVEKDKTDVVKTDTIEFPLAKAGHDKAFRQALLSPSGQVMLQSKPGTFTAKSEAAQTVDEAIASPGLSEVAILGKKRPQESDSYGSAPGIEIKALQVAAEATGKVVSKTDGQPLPGVAVMLKGSSFATTTDAKGEFSLPDSAKGTLDVKYLGFATKEVAIRPGEKPVIALEQDTRSLSEVVVASSGLNKKSGQSTFAGTPSIGWKKYNEYLETNARYPGPSLQRTDTVTITFTINDRGRLAGFKVFKSMAPYYDDEAIRLIKKGPKWDPAPKRQFNFAMVDVVFEKPVK